MPKREDVSISFTPAELASIHNDLIHVAHFAIGPRQAGAAKIVAAAQLVVAEIDLEEHSHDWWRTKSGTLTCACGASRHPVQEATDADD